MNTNKVDNKMNFSPIFDMVNQRQTILHELWQLQHQEEDLQNQLKELDKPFKDFAIDVEFYREFFKHYYLEKNDEKYFVTEIIEEFDNVDKVPFWSVKYIYENDNEKQSNGGPLSLRKFLHICDDGFTFKEKTT